MFRLQVQRYACRRAWQTGKLFPPTSACVSPCEAAVVTVSQAEWTFHAAVCVFLPFRGSFSFFLVLESLYFFLVFTTVSLPWGNAPL